MWKNLKSKEKEVDQQILAERKKPFYVIINTLKYLQD